MRLSSLFVLIVFVVVLCALTDVQAKRKRKGNARKTKKAKRDPKPKGKWTCDDTFTHRLTAEQLQKRVRLECKKGGLVSGLQLVGYNGTCQGLTPSLFVQMSTCFWQPKCTFTYDLSAENYMLKLFRGDVSHCILKHPSTFTFSYDCTPKKVPVLDVGQSDQTSLAPGGVVRSHEDHPWMYKRVHGNGHLTLKPPSKAKKYRDFVYTIRSLSLVGGDKLKVSWTAGGGGGEEGSTKLFTASDRVTLSDGPLNRTHVVRRAGEVTFSLSLSPYTNRGEGFVICFRWCKWKQRLLKKGICKKLIDPKKCKPKK